MYTHEIINFEFFFSEFTVSRNPEQVRKKFQNVKSRRKLQQNLQTIIVYVQL